MPGSLDKSGQLDPSKGMIFTCLGKKRSGKSKMALLIFDDYPYDRVVIDINGTDGPHKDVIELHGTAEDLPVDWPEDLRQDGKRMTLRYHPDMGSPTFIEDVDAVIGMTYRAGRKCLLIHEAGLIAKSTKTPPHMLRVLQSNRHRQVTAIFCAPRPKTMNTLVVGQADLLFLFELPSRDDRDCVADAIGWDKEDLSLAFGELGPHEYIRVDTNLNRPAEGEPDHRVVSVPALPKDVVQRLDHL